MAELVASYTTSVSPRWLLPVEDGAVAVRLVFRWDDAWDNICPTDSRHYPLHLERLEDTMRLDSNLLTSSLLERGMAAERIWQPLSVVFGRTATRSGGGQVIVLTDTGRKPASKSFICELLSGTLPPSSIGHLEHTYLRGWAAGSRIKHSADTRRPCVSIGGTDYTVADLDIHRISSAHTNLIVAPAQALLQTALRGAAEVFVLPPCEFRSSLNHDDKFRTAAHLYLLGLRALSLL